MKTKEEVRAEAVELVKSRTNFLGADEGTTVVGIQVATTVAEYIDQFFDDDRNQFDVIEAESEIVSDVVNPSTGHPSTIFDHASKLDVIAFDRYANEVIAIEHKSSSADLSPGSHYWRRLNLDAQVSKYLLSLRQSGRHEVRSCLYDVAAKPATMPKAVSAGNVREIAESGSFCGLTVSETTREIVARRFAAETGPKGGFVGKFHESEAPELYGLRLRSLIRIDPSVWFGRLIVTRTDEELELYARELWELTADVRRSRRTAISPRNSSACWSFSRACEFFDVCTGTEDVEDRSLFERLDSVHVELAAEFPDRGRDVITNSRIGTFLQCREKHRLKYEEGFAPVGRSDSGALFWGSLFHEALEIIWNSHRVPKGEKI